MTLLHVMDASGAAARVPTCHSLPLSASLFEWAIQAGGWLHLDLAGRDLLRSPVGVLLYLVFVPLYSLVPPAQRAAFLIVTSLLAAILTLGPAYTATLVALVLLSLAVVRLLSTHGRSKWGLLLLAVWFAGLLFYPQPAWLPPVQDSEPVYFYLHWAGLAYVFLKTLHVLADVSAGRMKPPRASDFLAYLFFAPTLRMGPIYRYGEFASQLHGHPREHRDVAAACTRLLTGLLRLGIMSAIMTGFPLDRFFKQPETLPLSSFLLGIYLAPITFYLWFSGYVDLSVAVGRFMGFAVPENFNHPWRAVSISEFWQRWHITLGAWLQDYVFTPLVRRRWLYFLSFTMTFLFCGLWHAPRACYIIWGTAQGVGLGVRRFWVQYWKRQERAGSPLYVRLKRVGLVSSPLSTALAWLLTFHFEIVTIMIGMDYEHAGRRVLGRLLALAGFAANLA